MSKEFNIRLARDHLNDYLRNESELRPSVIHTALDNAETLLTEGRIYREALNEIAADDPCPARNIARKALDSAVGSENQGRE